jgi:hypothetical protein
MSSRYVRCAPTLSVRDRAIIVLNDHRFWGYASGPSSSGNTLLSSIHGHAARRRALPRERFRPLALFGRGRSNRRCPLSGVKRTHGRHRGNDAIVESPGGFQLRALPEPCMTLSSHTAPDVRPFERLCLVHRLLPFPVGQWPRPNNAAPSLRPHYRAFHTTTGCSAPALRIGTLALAVGAACGLRSAPNCRTRRALLHLSYS